MSIDQEWNDALIEARDELLTIYQELKDSIRGPFLKQFKSRRDIRAQYEQLLAIPDTGQRAAAVNQLVDQYGGEAIMQFLQKEGALMLKRKSRNMEV